MVNVRRGMIVVGIKAMHCLFHDIDSSDGSYSHFAVWLIELLQVNNLSGVTHSVVPRIVSWPL